VNWRRESGRLLLVGGMAEQFVGLEIAVMLSNNVQLTGTVAKVDSTTQILHLRDGKSSPRGEVFARVC